MGMNAFVLFSGFGLGAMAFVGLLKFGFTAALAVFASGQLVLAFLALPLFRTEDSSAEVVGESTSASHQRATPIRV